MTKTISTTDFMGTVKAFKRPDLTTFVITRISGNWDYTMTKILCKCLNRNLHQSVTGGREYAQFAIKGNTAVIDVYWN